MKSYITLIILLLLTQLSYSQKELKIVLVSHEEYSNDVDLKTSFDNFLSDNPSIPFDTTLFKSIDYLESPNLVERSTIGSMKASNFILVNKALRQKLKPILIVKKKGQYTPYISSYFIVNNSSNI